MNLTITEEWHGRKGRVKLNNGLTVEVLEMLGAQSLYKISQAGKEIFHGFEESFEKAVTHAARKVIEVSNHV